MRKFNNHRPATGKDILRMEKGDVIVNFDELIKNSKIPYSENWAGEKYEIQNTPMKGINWIGNSYVPEAVIIKYEEGKYEEDNINILRISYAFETRNGKVDKSIKSNEMLIQQKDHKYPLLYFAKKSTKGSEWILIGKFSVDKIFEKYVTLKPFGGALTPKVERV